VEGSTDGGDRTSKRRRSADFQSAVSPTWSRQGVDQHGWLKAVRRAAEYNSAIQQIENLRYAFGQSAQIASVAVVPCHWLIKARKRLQSLQACRYSQTMLPKGPDQQLQRVHYELRTEGVKPEGANALRSGIHTRGYLPHVKREGARYFVTFRLADSLPKEVLLRLQAQRAERLTSFYAQRNAAQKLGTTAPPSDALGAIERDYYRELEQYLDRCCGECWFRKPEIAQIVARALRFFAEQRYHLSAWVVMPNHVHVVMWPMPNHTLSQILQSWKRFTAREANKWLGRTGQAFWQPESFDHWIRDDEEHERCCRYVVNNPVKARLCAKPEDWRWSSAWHDPTS
jgi:REP element-mobilizing transposase RayT